MEARDLGAVFNWVADDGRASWRSPYRMATATVTSSDGGQKRMDVERPERPGPISGASQRRITSKYLVSTYGGRHDTIGLSHMLICNGSIFEEIDTEMRRHCCGM